MNVTFINPDFGPAWSIPLNVGLFVLACLKAGIILRGLKFKLDLGTYGFFVLQLAIIYGLPILFALTNNDGVVSPKIMYGLWWLVGLLPVVYDQIARHDRRQREWDLVQRVIRRVYLIGPWIMLVAHVAFRTGRITRTIRWRMRGRCFLDWRWLPRGSSWNRRRGSAPRCSRAIGLLATLMMPASSLQWLVNIGSDFHQVTPIHFAIAGTMLTYGYMASTVHFVCALLSVFLMGVGYGLQNWIAQSCRGIVRFVVSLMPDSAITWGVTAIVAAFALLGVGSYLGLRRTSDKPTPTAP